jgi:hypothetical protein
LAVPELPNAVRAAWRDAAVVLPVTTKGEPMPPQTALVGAVVAATGVAVGAGVIKGDGAELGLTLGCGDGAALGATEGAALPWVGLAVTWVGAPVGPEVTAVGDGVGSAVTWVGAVG